MRLALVNAGVSPHNIAALELHGTGTPLGDPIEVDLLSPLCICISTAPFYRNVS